MTRALVLSGGGSVGIAWQTGLAAGLAAKGVDIADADFILGTSAGSAVGAQLATGADPSAQLERYRARQAAAEPDSTGSERAATSAPTGERLQKLMQVMAAATTEGSTPEESRAAIGRFALEADTPPEERFIAGFGYLADQPWPAHYACTAVDAESGEFVVFDRARPAPLERAVAASCAVPGMFPPITIDGRRYIDGGMRSGSNADLAEGHDKVLLVSLMSAARATANPADPRLLRYRERMEREQQVLTESGSTLHVVGPDEDAARVMGVNLMDGRLGPNAADTGYRQGEAVAAAVGEFWT